MKRLAAKIVVFAIALGLSLFFVCFLYPTVHSEISYPTDSRLESRFANSRDDFEALLVLFKEDRHLRSFDSASLGWIDFGEPADLPDERVRTYKTLLDKLGVTKVQRRIGHTRVEMQVWASRNFFIGEKYKYIVFDPDYSGPLVDSLDKVFRSGQDANQHKRLEKNWFIYIDIW